MPGRDEVREQQSVESGVRREEDVFLRTELVDGLQQLQGEVLLPGVEAAPALHVRRLVVVDGQALAVHGGQNRHEQKQPQAVHVCKLQDQLVTGDYADVRRRTVKFGRQSVGESGTAPNTFSGVGEGTHGVETFGSPDRVRGVFGKTGASPLLSVGYTGGDRRTGFPGTPTRPR